METNYEKRKIQEEKTKTEYAVECKYGDAKLEDCMLAIVQMKILQTLRKQETQVG